MKARAFYEARAKELIKELRETRQVSYADLALKLKSYGAPISERVLINRINRGTYSFAFAMMVLDALGAELLELPKPKDLYPMGPREGQALTKLDLRSRELKKPKGE
jgi:hypothetical protein